MGNGVQKFRVTAGAGQTGAVLVDGNHAVADPSLDGWAHFAFGLHTVIPGGVLYDQTGYDDKRHTYRQSYVNPNSYELWLDATDGLLHGAQPLPASVRRTRTPRPSRPGDALNAFPGLLIPPVGGGGFGGQGGGSLYPEDLLAFQWTVTGSGNYHNRRIVQRGDPISGGAGFTIPCSIPNTATYTVNLHVVFDDGRYGEQSATFTLRDFLLVSIGDSFASGEGNPDSPGLVFSGDYKCDAATLSRQRGWKPEMKPQPVWVEKLAHRSLLGAHAQAASALHRPYGRTLDAQGKPVTVDRITFVSTARSGAGITDGLFNSQKQPPNKDFIGIGQIKEVQRILAGRHIDALMVSIGGNDVGFSGVLQDLVKGDNVFTANDDNNPAAVLARIDAQFTQLDANYDLLKADIDLLLAPTKVYINGYPTALFDQTKDDGTLHFHACGLFQGWDLDIDLSDYQLIQQKGAELNTLIKKKARKYGWRFVDIAPDYVGRGYCDSRTLFVGASDSCRSQGDFEGTMHPTREAHRLGAEKFVAQLRRFSVPKPKPQAVPPAAPGQQVARPAGRG